MDLKLIRIKILQDKQEELLKKKLEVEINSRLQGKLEIFKNPEISNIDKQLAIIAEMLNEVPKKIEK